MLGRKREIYVNFLVKISVYLEEHMRKIEIKGGIYLFLNVIFLEIDPRNLYNNEF